MAVDMSMMLERVRLLRESAELLILEKLNLWVSFSFGILGLISLPFYWNNPMMGWISWACVLSGYISLVLSRLIRKQRLSLRVIL